MVITVNEFVEELEEVWEYVHSKRQDKDLRNG